MNVTDLLVKVCVGHEHVVQFVISAKFILAPQAQLVHRTLYILPDFVALGFVLEPEQLRVEVGRVLLPCIVCLEYLEPDTTTPHIRDALSHGCVPDL